MHELSVTENLLDLALRHAAAKGAAHITDLHLVIGQLSSIVDDSVQFYWDIVSEGTLAEGARLHFERIPAEMHCQDCQQRFALNQDDFGCPACGSLRIKVSKGDEFYLESIEIET